jgi:hypothetical protein
MMALACRFMPSGWSAAALCGRRRPSLPSRKRGGIVAISAAQMANMLDGIDWRNPVRTWRPEGAG